MYSKLSGLSLKASINLTSSSLKVEESLIPNKSLSDISKNSHILLQDGFNLCLFKRFLIKTRYVGEIGLDFSSKYIAYKDYQLKVFEDILRSIKGTSKILSIHCNKAENEVFQLLRKYELGHQSIIHWFSGDTKKCMLLSQLGCYFSINANMARKTNFIELIKLIGLNRVLVESDGPHTKISNNAGTNYINKIYDILKERLQIDNFEALVYENFKRLLSV